MSLIDRYVLRTTGSAFLALLVCLTAIVWLTQALRELDLVTAKGQTFWLFLGITGLGLPLLIAIIAPFALFLATMYTLNKLSADSELAVISSAGASPTRVLRPLLGFAIIVSIAVGWLSIVTIPQALQIIRDRVTKVHADLVTRILREGAFTTVDKGLTLHVRERGPGGALLGIFVLDARDPAQQLAYLAERGQIATEDDRRVLVLEHGSVQRRDNSGKDAAIVVFDRYAFDLSELASAAEVTTYKPRERHTLELLGLDPSDPALKGGYGRVRSEVHDRLASPLYPLAFVIVAYAFMGRPQSSRQGRGRAAMLAALTVLLIRLGGFAAVNLAARQPWAAAFIYALPLSAIFIGLAIPAGLRWPARSRRPRALPAT